MIEINHKKKLLAILFTLAFQSGCATVTVAGQHNTLSCSGVFGSSIQATESPLTTIEIKGVGFFKSPQSFTAGWVSEKRVTLSGADNCRIVFLPDNGMQIEKLAEILSKSGIDLSNVCLPGKGE